MSGNQTDWKAEFVNNSCYRMDESLRMVHKSVGLLSETEVWKRPNGSSNSIGHLIMHLRGNITQYVISSLGGMPDSRDRDSEFNTNPGFSKSELLGILSDTVEKAKKVIMECKADDLLRIREVQGFRLSGIGIVLHAVEHLSYHTGQIAFWTKLVKDRDLGFYEGTDLNIRNT